MGKYLESNLGRNERIICPAKISLVALFFSLGLRYFGVELAVTNKNVIGRTGLISKTNMSSPLNKVQNVLVKKGLFGSIFKYGTVEIDSASGSYKFAYVKKPEEFKRTIMTQMDIYEEERIKQQAAEMASAIKGNV